MAVGKLQDEQQAYGQRDAARYQEPVLSELSPDCHGKADPGRAVNDDGDQDGDGDAAGNRTEIDQRPADRGQDGKQEVPDESEQSSSLAAF